MKNVILSLLILLPVLTNGQIITTIAGTGTKGYSGDNGPATNAQLSMPVRICRDGSGNILFSDQRNNVIRKIDPSGIITTIAGNGTTGYAGDNGPATAAALNGPSGLDVDTAGYLYISDAGNNVIRKINTSGIISTIAGDGVSGFSGDNGPATAAEIGYPLGLKIDKYGNIFFADFKNKRIRKIDNTGIISSIAGNGGSIYSGDGNPATDEGIGQPGGIAVNNSGDIFISDYLNHFIRKVDAGGIITTFAGGGILSGVSADNKPATAVELKGPNGVYVDDDHNNVYIIDYIENIVRRVDAHGIILTVAGNGTQGYSGDNGPATAAQLNGPNDITVNAAGDIFIADENNYAVRKFSDRPWEAVESINSILQNVTIYPNPAQSQVTIKAERIQHIALLNMVGETVYEQAHNITGSALIDIGKLASGIYYVKVNGMFAGKFAKE